MQQQKITLPLFDVERLKAILQSPEYKARVEQAMRDVESLKSHAVIDRARLFIPVDF